MTYTQRVRRFRIRLLKRAHRLAGGDALKMAALLGMTREGVYQALRSFKLKDECPMRDRRRRASPPPAIEPAPTKPAPKRRSYFGVDVTP